MASPPNSRKLLRIHRNDNVFIVVSPVQPGDKDTVEGQEIVFTQRVAIGHKVAAQFIHESEKIFKCGVPIGSASEDIPAGAHIHLHNLQSNYLETYTLDKDHVYVK
jgi:hypothetical protein